MLCIFTTTNANTFFCLASGPPVCLWKQGEGRDADVGLGLGAAPFPLPSLERTFDGYESPEKYFASSPTDDDDGSKGGTRQGGAAPICKQISAMAQPLPPSFIKMNCSGKRVLPHSNYSSDTAVTHFLRRPCTFYDRD